MLNGEEIKGIFSNLSILFRDFLNQENLNRNYFNEIFDVKDVVESLCFQCFEFQENNFNNFNNFRLDHKKIFKVKNALNFWIFHKKFPQSHCIQLFLCFFMEDLVISLFMIKWTFNQFIYTQKLININLKYCTNLMFCGEVCSESDYSSVLLQIGFYE